MSEDCDLNRRLSQGSLGIAAISRRSKYVFVICDEKAERLQQHCDAPGHLQPQATRGGGPLTLGDAVDTTFAQRKSCRSRS